MPYKAFCGILNNRLSSWLEEERIIHEAQNGFRQGRSCLEHVFALSTLVNTCKKLNLDTVVCFVDFQKTYDKVDRSLLLQKLQSFGLEADFVQIIAALYSANTSCVRINGKLSSWFEVNIGVRQGCVLSPTIFIIYVNDVASVTANFY